MGVTKSTKSTHQNSWSKALTPPTRITVTDLPTRIIHHIASFLSLKDMIRMSAASKTWSCLCYEHPALRVNIDEEPNASCFVQRLLSNRNGVPLQNLLLICTNPRICRSYIGRWMLNAVYANVQELDLCIGFDKSFVLPIGQFNPLHLRVFRLEMDGGRLSLDSSPVFRHLHELSLILVQLPEDDTSAWLSTRCVALKKLYLYHCYGFNYLNIHSESLERAKIAADPRQSQLHLSISCSKLTILYVVLLTSYHSWNTFKLSAPNLQIFSWNGSASEYSLDCLTSLRCARIDISYHSLRGGNNTTGWKFSKDQIDLFAGLIHAKSLWLHSWSMVVCSKSLEMRPSLFFNNLKSLTLDTYFNNCEARGMAYLFARCPNLVFLMIQPEKDHYVSILELLMLAESDLYLTRGVVFMFQCQLASNSITDIDYWELQDLDFVQKLKTAEISVCGSRGNHLELVKYLLKHAIALEKMSIRYPFSDRENAWKTAEMVKSFDTASRTVEVFFLWG